MPDHNYFSNLIWQIADLLRGPYRPPQYERVMLPMTVLRRFDCVLAPTKAAVVRKYEQVRDRYQGDALDRVLNKVSGQRFHNHSPLDFARLKGDPDHVEKHLRHYLQGFSANVRRIFDYFELETEIEKMREANILYLVVSKFADVDLHPSSVPNEQMGHIFENLIRRFNELANETAGDHFTPREVIRLMVSILFIHDDALLATPGTVRKLLDPACGTGGDFNQADQLFFDQIVEAAMADDGIRQAAAVNPDDKFELVFKNLLESLFVERMDQNEEIFVRFMNDVPFQKVVTAWMASEAYRRLRGGAGTETQVSDVTEEPKPYA